MEWGALLVGQLEFYWDVHLRPRLDGLSDDEYLWEPVPGCWSVRPGPEGRLMMDPVSSPAVDGVNVTDSPRPEPSPITTIAWRMLHIGIGGFATRVSTFFGDGSIPDDADMFDPRPRSSDHRRDHPVDLRDRLRHRTPRRLGPQTDPLRRPCHAPGKRAPDGFMFRDRTGVLEASAVEIAEHTDLATVVHHFAVDVHD